jgi:hypothetical protein
VTFSFRVSRIESFYFTFVSVCLKGKEPFHWKNIPLIWWSMPLEKNDQSSAVFPREPVSSSPRAGWVSTAASLDWNCRRRPKSSWRPPSPTWLYLPCSPRVQLFFGRCRLQAHKPPPSPAHAQPPRCWLARRSSLLAGVQAASSLLAGTQVPDVSPPSPLSSAACIDLGLGCFAKAFASDSHAIRHLILAC